MTDGPLMDAACIHDDVWYECTMCMEDLAKLERMEDRLNGVHPFVD